MICDPIARFWRVKTPTCHRSIRDAKVELFRETEDSFFDSEMITAF